MTIPNAPYDPEVYKSTLKDERIRTSVLLYIAILITVVSILGTITLFKQGDTTQAIRDTQVSGSTAVKSSVSAAVFCALTLNVTDYDTIYKCVFDKVNEATK